MSVPVVVTATASAPPVGTTSAPALGLWGSLQAVASPSAANTAATQLPLTARTMKVLRLRVRVRVGQEPHRVLDRQFRSIPEPTLVATAPHATLKRHVAPARHTARRRPTLGATGR